MLIGHHQPRFVFAFVFLAPRDVQQISRRLVLCLRTHRDIARDSSAIMQIEISSTIIIVEIEESPTSYQCSGEVMQRSMQSGDVKSLSVAVCIHELNYYEPRGYSAI